MADNNYGGRGRGRGGRGGGDRGGGRGGGSGFRGGGFAGGRGDFQGGRGDFGGGRGGGRGDFGGGRGGGRGDFGGGRGGGRGDFGGGRGGGRGDFGGGRGGGRGDFGGRGGGRGDFGGGRGRGGGGGGFRGGRGGFGPDVYPGVNNNIPAPDAQVTTLENAWISERNSLAAKMGKLTVKDGGNDYFPVRPNFGTMGSEVTLWANYFKLDVGTKGLFKYNVKVSKVQEKKETESKAPPKKKGENDDDDDVTGRKRVKVIAMALSKFPATVTLASEFKAQVISLEKLKLPEGGIMEVDFQEAGRDRVEKHRVTFSGPESLDISRLLTYLNDFKDTGNESVFPKFPGEVDALGVILGHTARSDPNTSAVGKSRYFAIDQNRIESGPMHGEGLISILRGYVQSVRMATGRLLLQVNVTHGVFRRSPAEGPIKLDELFERLRLNLMDRLNQAPRNFVSDLTRVHKFLNKSKILCRVPGDRPGEWIVIERTIAGLASTRDGKKDDHPPEFRDKNFPFASPSTVRFFLRKPKTDVAAPQGLSYDSFVTVADYYRARYQMNAKLNIPLINVGTMDKPVYVLAENCKLVLGQVIKSKLSPKEQDSMIQFACRSPAANAISVTQNARKVLDLDNNSLLKKFKVSVDKELITVKARELGPPIVTYPKGGPGSLEAIQPRDGGWLLKGVKVTKGGRFIKTWTTLEIFSQAADNQVKSTVAKFVGFIASMGVSINKAATPPAGFSTRIPNGEPELRRVFEQLAKSKPALDLVIVVLPAKDTQLYNLVKKLGEIDFGIQTQCVVKEKIMQEKGQLGYFANVALKVNLKFGGINHKLKDEHPLIKNGKTMVVGYDVTHPTNLGPAADNAPSLVGLVASIDSALNQWPAVAWQNPPRVEALDDKLVDKFKSRLQLWQKHNQGRLPENILIYRDGVSEGQFSMVLEKELPHIRKACTQMYAGGKQPRIAIIVSVKRHQTRFYPTDANHIHPRSKSPKEGTIVDRGVTNVRYWDYYLQAHASLQGTARPAHYTVLMDEIFRADYGTEAANQLQKLTHDMCYLYGRATKAVSICPPAYYADLVCTRARVHKDELFDDASSMASSLQDNIGSRSVHQNLVDTMYYM